MTKSSYKLEDFLFIKDLSKKIKDFIVEKVAVEKQVVVSDLYNCISKKIVDANCKLLFPVNICGPGTLAHDSLQVNDTRIYKHGFCKIDFGIIYKSAKIDTAITVNLSPEDLTKVKALHNYKLAFKKIVDYLKVGLKISQLGCYIEKTMLEHDLFVVPFLCGHSITANSLHADPVIYNTENKTNQVLFPGQLFTVQPFVVLRDSTNYRVVSTEPLIHSYNNHYFLKQDVTSAILKKSIAYDVLTIHDKITKLPVQSIQEEHTFLITEDGVINCVS